jgi:hypothetical protein
MGTRSTIALEFADGTVEQIYCHWDGYLEHNGKILAEHYSDPFKLRDLIDLGDMSILAPEIGTQHAFDKPPEGVCTFYKRDRNEEGVESKKFANFNDYRDNHQYEEYEYILRNVEGKATWFVADHSNRYISLEVAMESTKEEA